MLHISAVWRKCWLTGLIVVISFGKCALEMCDNEPMTKDECSQTTIDGMPCTNCSSPKPNQQCQKSDLPGDLESTMKCLYSYNVQLKDINSKTFQKYPDLTHLLIVRGGFGSNFPKNTFEPLKKLQVLNLSYTNWWTNTEISWPPSLKILDITKLPVDTFVALALHSLEVLNVSGTDITEFPTLNENAPLKIIVLDNVNLTNFKIEELAKLCKLESLSTLNTSLGNDNCKCLMLKAWTEKYNVKIINEMSCKADTKCSQSFSETSLKNRNECLSKTSNRIWYIIIAVLIGLLLLVMCACGFVYTWLIKTEEKEGILGITDEQLEHYTPRPQPTTTKPPEAVEEDTPAEGEGDGGAPPEAE